MRTSFLLFTLLMALSAPATEISDSLKSRTDSLRREVKLSEVVVKAQGASIVKDGISYIPTKTAKKVSMSPEDLLRRMPISNIQVDGTTVTNLYKDRAAFFVNGKKASTLEIETLLPKNIRRVLVLENPSDPKYRSEKFVVDFITDPPYGGYVILRPAYTFFKNNGWYEALGKVVTGKSTFMAKGNFIHGDRKGGYSSRMEHYDLTDEKTGETLDLTRYASESDMLRRGRQWDATAEWRYDSSDKEYHEVVVQYQQDKEPVKSNHGFVDEDRIFNRSSSNSRNFGFHYNYNRFFQSGAGLYADATFRCSSNEGKSTYINSDFPAIFNGYNENVYGCMIRVGSSHPLKHNNSLKFMAFAVNSFYSVDYSGTANLRRQTRSGTYDLSAIYSHNFTYGDNRFRLSANVGLPVHEIEQKNGRHAVSVDYNARVDLNSSFGDSHTLGFRASGEQEGRSLSVFNGVDIQQTELLGKTGNDRIKPVQTYSLQAVYTWLATREFNLSFSAFYTHEMNVLCTRYFLSDGLVYTQSVNSGIRSDGGVAGGAVLRFMNDAFTAYAGGSVRKMYANGLFSYNTWVATTYVQLLYMHSNGFTAMVDYRPPTGKTPDGSMMTRNLSHRFYLNAGYAAGNLNIMVYCEPFYKFTHTRNYIERNGVSIIDDDHSRLHRYLNIDVKYVFDFGKRQKHDENIGSAATKSTSL